MFNFNDLINNLNLNQVGKLEIKEELLKHLVVIRENGQKVDIDTYIKTLIIETLESVLGGDKDERKS